MKDPRVSIIILNWNGLEDTVECLQFLHKIDYENYNVTVVDNGSEGKEAESWGRDLEIGFRRSKTLENMALQKATTSG